MKINSTRDSNKINNNKYRITIQYHRPDRPFNKNAGLRRLVQKHLLLFISNHLKFDASFASSTSRFPLIIHFYIISINFMPNKIPSHALTNK